MKYEVGEEVMLVDGTRGKVVSTVGRRGKGDHEHRLVQFQNASSAIYHVSELLPAEIADAAEPTTKPSKPVKGTK